MSTFDNPFDPERRLDRTGCSCGRHRSQAEHDAQLALQCTPIESEDKRYQGVVASAVMRAVFPKDAARRAFLKSVGASTALAALSQLFPLKTATDVFALGGPIEVPTLEGAYVAHTLKRGVQARLLGKERNERGEPTPERALGAADRKSVV